MQLMQKAGTPGAGAMAKIHCPTLLSRPIRFRGLVFHFFVLELGFTFVASKIVPVMLILGVGGAFFDMVLSPALPHLIMGKHSPTEVARVRFGHLSQKSQESSI